MGLYKYLFSLTLLFIIVVLTFHSFWLLLHKDSKFDVNKASKNEAIEVVWASSWITAAATGLGVIPFLFNKDFNAVYIAIGNAIAAGMMISASMGLVAETITLEYALIDLNEYVVYLDSSSLPSTTASGVANGDKNTKLSTYHTLLTSINMLAPAILLVIGALLGVGFIHESRKRLDQYKDFSVMDIHGSDARKVVLIMIVMTVHSMSEGIGIGVSYHSHALGIFVSATLAVHNIPEGIAISMVMIPRGVSRLNTTLWCVFSSIPQPILAVPSFLFVEQFKPLVPLGLGFAAGAMFYVALFDLLVEAQEELDAGKTMAITTASAMVMAVVQVLLRDEGEMSRGDIASH